MIKFKCACWHVCWILRCLPAAAEQIGRRPSRLWPQIAVYDEATPPGDNDTRLSFGPLQVNCLTQESLLLFFAWAVTSCGQGVSMMNIILGNVFQVYVHTECVPDSECVPNKCMCIQTCIPNKCMCIQTCILNKCMCIQICGSPAHVMEAW